ncbi:MAG: InlB B-repeat-containing protein, partial [Bacilli bacterium]
MKRNILKTFIVLSLLFLLGINYNINANEIAPVQTESEVALEAAPLIEDEGSINERGSMNRNNPVWDYTTQNNLDPSYTVPDVNLRKVINKALGKVDDDIINYNASITELNNIKYDINLCNCTGNWGSQLTDYQSLEGLQYLTSTKKIEISNSLISESDLQYISGLSQLESLVITSAIFKGNDPGTIKRWETSVNRSAQYSVVEFNIDKYIDLSVLGGLVNLKYLRFDFIGHDSPSRFSYRNNMYVGVSGLKTLTKLENLDLNNISEMDDVSASFLENMTNLKDLSLGDTPVNTTEYIIRLEKLKDLEVYGTQIRDFSLIYDKPYFNNGNYLNAYYDVYYDEVPNENGVIEKVFTLDTQINGGPGIKDFTYNTTLNQQSLFEVVKVNTENNIIMDFKLNGRLEYEYYNYKSGKFDNKKSGINMILSFNTSNDININYRVISLNIGKRITFDTNYEGGAKPVVNVPALQLIDEPTNITREGYDLIGWYTDSKFINLFDFETMVHENMTLYARWSKAS